MVLMVDFYVAISTLYRSRRVHVFLWVNVKGVLHTCADFFFE